MIKNKINSKTVIIVIVTLILMGLIIFFVGRSYGFFQYVKKGETTNVVSIKGIRINVIEDDNALNLENAEPLYDKDSMELKAFKFSMTNTSSRPIEYTIRVANDTEKQQACLINEGEENEETCPVLTTDNIRFSYKLNDSNWSEPINLGGTNNDTITTYTINGGETLTYSVKIWIKSDATNEIMNHYFYGQLLIQGAEATQPRVVMPTMEEMCPDCVYTYTTDDLVYDGTVYTTYKNTGITYTNTILTSSEYKTNYQDVVAESGKNYFLGLKLDDSGILERAYTCGINDGTPFCIEGSLDGSTYTANNTLLNTIYGPYDSNTNLGCVTGDYVMVCYGSVIAYSIGTGDVRMDDDRDDNNGRCDVSSDGYASCHES